jgi:hypothetical protein
MCCCGNKTLFVAFPVPVAVTMKFAFSALSRPFVSYIVIDVSEDQFASIFMAEEMKMNTVRSLKTFMNIYQTTRHMSEDSIQRNIYQFICT